jgi:aldehyde dehydrogenase (NAD+)
MPDSRVMPLHACSAGMIGINGAPHCYTSPFVGYKQSGNGREWGEFGFDDFLETKYVSS